MLGVIALLQNQFKTIDFSDRLAFALIGGIILAFFGNMNVYRPQAKIINVVYSKLIFTDSTEKLIIFMTSPEVKTINQSLSTNEYYTLKENQKNIKMTITESGEYDHWSYLLHKEDKKYNFEEWTYGFIIKSNGITIKNDNWNKTKKRLFIKNKKQKEEK